MTRTSAQTLGSRKRIRTCGHRTLVFWILHTCLIITYSSMSVKAMSRTRRPHKYYSAYAERDHFMDAIGRFTNLRVSNRFVAGSHFLKAPGLGDSERDLLRFFITDYLKFHRSNRANATRRLVYRPQRVGNGDRFDIMLFAYWTAVLSGRLFLLDWDKPYPLSLFLTNVGGAKLFLDRSEKNDSLSVYEQCTSPNCILITHDTGAGNYFEKALKSKTKTVFMHTHKLPTAVPENFVTQRLPENIPMIAVESFRTSEVFKRAVLHHVLRPANTMITDHDNVARQLQLTPGIMRAKARGSSQKQGKDFVDQKARKYISVHARLGMGVGEQGAERFKVVATRMKDMAMCLASPAVRLAVMSGNPPVPIFLATDTVEFRDLFKQVVKQISAGNVEVVFGNWSTLHVAKIHLLDMNKKEKDQASRDSAWGSFMDLVLLGHAEHIVALYSGFPRLAFAFGDAETLVELRNEICIGKR